MRFGTPLLIFCSLAAACSSMVQSPRKDVPADGTHRVVVMHPEQWPNSENRNCYIGTYDVVHKDLWTLDCDRLAHETPRSRMFVIDVRFSGNFDPANNQTSSEWTCQKEGASLICKQ